LKVLWKDKYLLGVVELDKHHKHIVDLINLIVLFKVSELEVSQLLTQLKELLEYSAYHFSVEERYIEDLDKHFSKFHRLEHKAFLKKVDSFIDKFSKGIDPRTFLELKQFLKYWVLYHIGETDLKIRSLVKV
jgi:hemerythrin